MTSTDGVAALRERIEAALSDRADEAVAEYFDPDNDYAGATFNTLGANEPGSFGPDDLVAVHLLGIDFRPETVRKLLEDGPERRDVSALLADIPSGIDIWDKRADVTEGSVADQLWHRLTTYKEVGWVTAGKLLARKRPHLIPIYDSVVAEWLNRPDNVWTALQECLRDGSLRERICQLRPDGLRDVSEVTSLRLLDVAIWMAGKRFGPYRPS